MIVGTRMQKKAIQRDINMLPQPGTARAELRADGYCCQPLLFLVCRCRSRSALSPKDMKTTNIMLATVLALAFFASAAQAQVQTGAGGVCCAFLWATSTGRWQLTCNNPTNVGLQPSLWQLKLMRVLVTGQQQLFVNAMATAAGLRGSTRRLALGT
jgi:hypothetical protein